MRGSHAAAAVDSLWKSWYHLVVPARLDGDRPHTDSGSGPQGPEAGGAAPSRHLVVRRRPTPYRPAPAPAAPAPHVARAEATDSGGHRRGRGRVPRRRRVRRERSAVVHAGRRHRRRSGRELHPHVVGAGRAVDPVRGEAVGAPRSQLARGRRRPGAGQGLPGPRDERAVATRPAGRGPPRSGAVGAPAGNGRGPLPPAVHHRQHRPAHRRPPAARTVRCLRAAHASGARWNRRRP